MALSYVLYISVLLAIVLLSWYADLKGSNVACWWIIVILTLVAGLRGSSVGLDTEMYLSKFLLIYDGRLDLAYGFEETFKYICLLLMRLFHTPQIVMLIFALITNACIIKRLWDFRHISSFPFVVSFYYMIFFFTSMNTVRQFCAIAIVFYSTRQLTRHNYLRYLVAVGIAFLFHKSSIIGVLLLASELVHWKTLERKKKFFFVGIIACSPLIFYFVLLQLLRYEHYFSRVHIDIGSMNIVKIVFFIATALLIFVAYKKENYIANWRCRSQEDNDSLSLICLSYFLGLCLVFLGYVLRFADRIGWYFLIFESVYYGMIWKTNTKLNKLLLGAITLFLTGWAFIYSMTNNSQGTMPYTFFWE